MLKLSSMKWHKDILTSFALMGYISVSLFGLLFMFSMPHHSMSSIEPCPFMLEEHAICPMTALDHMSAWRSTFQFNLVKFFSLCILFFVVFVFIILKPPSSTYFYLNQQNIFEDFMTSLFSSGLLNGKVF